MRRLRSFQRLSSVNRLSFFLAAFAAILLAGCRTTAPIASFEGLPPRISAPAVLQFWGEPFYARFSALQGGQTVIEYYRADETPRAWKALLSLRLDPSAPDGWQLASSMEKLLKAGGNAVTAYQTTNGPGVEFVRALAGNHEVTAIRYANRPNGTVSLQFSRVIPTDQVRRMRPAQRNAFFTNLRSNAAWGLEAMAIPHIDKLP